MHYLGWMVALLAIGVVLGPDPWWAVAVLVAGPVLLLVMLRDSLGGSASRTPAFGPRSIDVEAAHIRELQAALGEDDVLDEARRTRES